MRYPWILCVAALAACSNSDPTALGRLTGGDGGAGATEAGEMAAAGAGGASAATDGGNDALKRWLPGDDRLDAGPDIPMVPAGQIRVTWTFKYCGDNAISVGVIDQTANRGLAGPVSVSKPRGSVFTLQSVSFTCAPGDIVCWSASDGSGMCGVCSDGATPVIGC